MASCCGKFPLQAIEYWKDGPCFVHFGPPVRCIMLCWKFKDWAPIQRPAGSGRLAVMAETTGKMGEIFYSFIHVTRLFEYLCMHAQCLLMPFVFKNRVNVSFPLWVTLWSFDLFLKDQDFHNFTYPDDSIPLQEPSKRQTLEDLLYKLTNYKSENRILPQQPGDMENQEKNRRDLDNLRVQQRQFGCRMFFWKSWTYCWC